MATIKEILETSGSCREFRRRIRIEKSYESFLEELTGPCIAFDDQAGGRFLIIADYDGDVVIRFVREIDEYYSEGREVRFRPSYRKDILSHIYSLYGNVQQLKNKKKSLPLGRKLYRYMSHTEFEKLMAGETLVWESRPEIGHANSTTKGFAFLKEENILEGAQHVYGPWSAARCYQFLEDVVSPDCLVEFVPSAEIADKFVLAMGTYNDVTARDFEFFTPPTFCMRELDLPSYSKHVLTPVRVVRKISYQWEEIPKRWEKVN